MVAAMPLELVELPVARSIAHMRGVDERITLDGVGWDGYVALCDTYGERRGVRMTYLKGTLEIMTTSVKHELTNSAIGRLVEAYADEMRIALYSHGRATFRRRAAERGLEPDECYALRPLQSEDDVPDLAIEVILTSGGLDKLDVYAGLGVPEVWLWESGNITVHHLGEGGYTLRGTSRILPGLNVEELAAFVDADMQPQSVWIYRDKLRQRAAARRQ
jgi:Uma2 family endonuclease